MGCVRCCRRCLLKRVRPAASIVGVAGGACSTGWALGIVVAASSTMSGWNVFTASLVNSISSCTIDGFSWSAADL